MDAQVIRSMALSIVNQLEHASDRVKGEWASWAMADQVNKMIDVAGQALGEEMKPLLPPKFRQSMKKDYAVARYVDVAIAAGQIAALLEPRKVQKKPA